MLDQSLIEEIKKQADIVKVISCYLNVIKKGKDYLAVCPFHNDTNPSLHISPEKQIFNCFVCHTGGDVFSFVRKKENISYIEAVKKVAELIGFHDPRLENDSYKKPVDQKKVPLLKCLHDLTTYYQYALSTEEGKVGEEYFLSRNLDKEMQEKYKLGYAFNDGKNTISFLQSKGHSLKTIEDCGLCTVINGQYSDKNKGRVVFPICDYEGNVIGYSARTLKKDDDAKYVNTQETYLFHKSNVLYNYHIAKQNAHIDGYVYVLEGFMDVFALSRIGINSAVALMGTALTNEHINLLRKLNVQVRICLDGDLPGQTAAMKAAKLLDQAGLDYMIVDNQGSELDPDEILNQKGKDELKLYLEKLTNRVDFALNYFLRSNPLKSINEKKNLIKEFIPILKNINSAIEFDSYIRKLAKITDFEVESIRKVVNDAKKVENDSVATSKVINSFNPEKKLFKRLELAEREILYQMTNHKEAVDFYEEKVGSFYDSVYRTIANYIIEYASNHDDIDVSGIICALEASDLEDRESLVNELTRINYERNHPDECTPELLDGLLECIQEEKEKIFEQDTIKASLEGKSPQEQARILAEYNKKKAKKLS